MSVWLQILIIAAIVLATGLVSLVLRRSALGAVLLAAWLLGVGAFAVTPAMLALWPLDIAYPGSIMILCAWLALAALQRPLLGAVTLIVSLLQPVHAILADVPTFPWLALLSLSAFVVLTAARGWTRLRVSAAIGFAIWFCQASLGLGLPDTIAFWIVANVLGLVTTALGQRLGIIRQIRGAGQAAMLSGIVIAVLSLFALGDPGIMNEAYLAFPVSWRWFAVLGVALALLGLINLMIPSDGRRVESRVGGAAFVLAGVAALMLLNVVALTGILSGWVMGLMYRFALACTVVWLFQRRTIPGFRLLAHLSLLALLIAAGFETGSAFFPDLSVWLAAGSVTVYGFIVVLLRRPESSAPTAQRTPIPPRRKDT